MLQRRGLALMKSKRRDPKAIDYGRYLIVNADTEALVASSQPTPHTMTLDEVEAWLNAN